MNPIDFVEFLKNIKNTESHKGSREDKIQALKTFFCCFFSEDPQDGSDFDCEVLRRLDEVLKGSNPTS